MHEHNFVFSFVLRPCASGAISCRFKSCNGSIVVGSISSITATALGRSRFGSGPRREVARTTLEGKFACAGEEEECSLAQPDGGTPVALFGGGEDLAGSRRRFAWDADGNF